jgi:small subunit ribosomal protein S16
LLKIRLSRVGKKKRPSYRIVVADSRAARDGALVDTIGHYDPLTDPATIVINEEKALHWLQRGAQPSEAAAKLLAKSGIGGGEKQTSEAEPEGGGEET